MNNANPRVERMIREMKCEPALQFFEWLFAAKREPSEPKPPQRGQRFQGAPDVPSIA